MSHLKVSLQMEATPLKLIFFRKRNGHKLVTKIQFLIKEDNWEIGLLTINQHFSFKLLPIFHDM